jgi:aspartate carbamoyltransferase catalytic subunit
MSHFLSTCGLTNGPIFRLLEQAESYLLQNKLITPSTLSLQHKIVANLFFENSTRTRCSFEIAVHKLGGHVLQFDTHSASIQKGETVRDTVENLTAMGVDIYVIRHTEEGLPAKIATQLGDRAAVINAGDGMQEHPTQAMLDLFTIYRHKQDFSGLSVAIVGDIRHSRVARSLCFALSTVGVSDIRLVGPTPFLPTEAFYPWNAEEKENRQSPIRQEKNLHKGIQDADVVIMLRIQQERMHSDAGMPMDKEEYIQHYRLTTEALRHAKPNAIVMHPGPINRDIEITSEVADGPQSVILEQPKLGVAMRMAILEGCLSS